MTCWSWSPRAVASILATCLLITAIACTSSSRNRSEASAAGSAASSTVSLDKDAYPVFPNRDRGADAAVPADQGGAGFDGRGWQTDTGFELVGDPRAVKGGVIHEHLADFPATLRNRGPESNTEFNDQLQPLLYETLLTLHPTTLQWIPALATHWQISPDKRTYRFRINPNARFANGQPVTADDVVASWAFVVSRDLQDPAARLVFDAFDKPIAESPYIVRVTSHAASWRNFQAFAGSLYVMPGRVLRDLNPARYVTDYNYAPLPGSGPYAVGTTDVIKGQRITIKRRRDYWAANDRRNVGRYNFDEIEADVIRDPVLALETFKRGALDYLAVNSSRQWAQQMDFDAAARGLVQKRRVFNAAPSPIQGIAFNTRRQPWADVRVREALAHLLNRTQLIEKLFFDQYVPQNSYFAGTAYENRDNVAIDYDPARAAALLADAGWSSRDGQGRLVRGGTPLVVDLVYGQKSSEAFLTVYQEDLRRAGITLNLRLATPETLFQMVMDRRFDTALMAWSSDLFPDPHPMFDSRLADQPNTNNITGFRDAKVDALLAQYDTEFDQAKRAAILQQIDRIATDAHHYVLQWYAPYRRVAYWDLFGHPPGYFTRTGTAADAVSLWWRDPAREERLTRARAESSPLPVEATDVRYWIDYQRSADAGAQAHR